MAQGLYPKTTTFYEAIVLAGPSVLQRNEYEVLLSLIGGGGGVLISSSSDLKTTKSTTGSGLEWSQRRT